MSGSCAGQLQGPVTSHALRLWLLLVVQAGRLWELVGVRQLCWAASGGCKQAPLRLWLPLVVQAGRLWELVGVRQLCLAAPGACDWASHADHSQDHELAREDEHKWWGSRAFIALARPCS